MVSVACFGVRVSVMFRFMFVLYTLVRFGLLSGHLLGNICQLGWPYVLFVFCLFVIFIYFAFWQSGIWLLLVQFLFIAFL